MTAANQPPRPEHPEPSQKDRRMGSLLGRESLRSLVGKRCAVSWSGGKDSCLAACRAVKAGARVEVLINMRVEGGERSRSHGLRRGVIEAQAETMGRQLIGVGTSWKDYETNFVTVLRRLAAEGIEAVIFGDIDLQAHLEWEEMVCFQAGLIPVLPVWQGGRMELVHEFTGAGFETRIVALKAALLSADYLGHRFTYDLAAEFERQGIDACGENGEFHTVVTGGPLFRRPIELVPGERVLRDGYWFLDFAVRTVKELSET